MIIKQVFAAGRWPQACNTDKDHPGRIDIVINKENLVHAFCRLFHKIHRRGFHKIVVGQSKALMIFPPQPYYVFIPIILPTHGQQTHQNQLRPESVKVEEPISDEGSHNETKISKPSGITRGKGQLWTSDEVDNLVAQYKKYNGNWSQIVKHLKGRNISQCSQKYRKLADQVKRTKNKWSVEEDRILLENYEKFGRQWVSIANQLPGRTSKQVRDRFVNQLNPQLNREAWTEEEDLIILKEYEKHGPRWAIINKLLNNRSENQVKNRFYYCIQKKYKGELHSYLKIQE